MSMEKFFKILNVCKKKTKNESTIIYLSAFLCPRNGRRLALTLVFYFNELKGTVSRDFFIYVFWFRKLNQCLNKKYSLI